MTPNTKLFLTVAALVTLIWLLSGAFIAGTFNVAEWNGVAKTFCVIFWMAKLGVAAGLCYGKDSMTFISRMSSFK